MYIYNEIGLNGNKLFRLSKFILLLTKFKTYFSQVIANAQ